MYTNILLYVIKYRIQLLMQSRFKKNMIDEVFRTIIIEHLLSKKKSNLHFGIKIIVVRNIFKLLKRIPDKIMHN